MTACRYGRAFPTEQAAARAKPGAKVRECHLGDHVHARYELSASVTPKRQESGQKARRTVRDTGPDAATRKLVLERDGHCCAACGVSITGRWYSLQHRKARGVGGDSQPQNLVVLCGSATSPGCHRKAEDRRADMHQRGLWLRSDENPLLVPVEYHIADGGFTRWLTAAGGLSETAPELVAS